MKFMLSLGIVKKYAAWFLILLFCLLLTADSSVHIRAGHYPHTYCILADVMLNLTERRFFYKADSNMHQSCGDVGNIWPLSHSKSLSLYSACEEVHEVGHAFTIFYWAGGSNYFHLHYDMLIPLYAAIYHKTLQFSGLDMKHVFMPTVETRRLQEMDWNTLAFTDASKYWVQMTKSIVGHNIYMPLDSQLSSKAGVVCFKSVNFGVPSVTFSDRSLVHAFVHFIQQNLHINISQNVEHRIGIITRSSRRKILNEAELVDALRSLAEVDLIEFSGMTFRDQVALMQKYAVLIGMNGAGLTNGLYLRPGGVVLQLVPYPYRLQLNNIAFGELLRGGAGGGYFEWHNQHSNLTDYQHGDTVVTVSEIVDIAQQALNIFDSEQRRSANDEL